MSTWQQKLRQGNADFNSCRWLQAESAYRDAAEQLAKLWASKPQDTQLMMAWIVSMHNLASLFERLDEPETASPFLFLPYRRVLSLLQTSDMSEAFHFDLLRALRYTAIPLLEFSQRHPVCQSCADHLQAVRQWLNAQAVEVTPAASVRTGSVATMTGIPSHQLAMAQNSVH
ncbi:hypothetical protein ACWJJH_19020 [Endozoicomonadaceae bacterium StTr2]